ncbi:MAG: hypothetical protein ACRENU_10555 [Gemmatimonadaceae bacterium]
MSVARRMALAAGLVVAALGISVLLAEGALRLMVPTSNVYRMMFPGTRVFEPDRRFVHGIEGPARYIVNKDGIRGPDFGPDSSEYRVFLVGGSTTECGMLDESENWGSVAQRELGQTRDGRRVWLGNVGRSGLTSRDHAVTVKYLLKQHPRMDVVVILLGVNDLTSALRQGPEYRSPPSLNDPDAERNQIRNAFALSPAGFREMLTEDMVPERTPWYKETQLYQLAKRARTGLQARQVVTGIGGAILGQWRDNRRSASRIIDTLPDLTRPLADYRQSLETIARNAREGNAEVIFLTQPSLWKPRITPAEERLLWLGGTGKFQEEPGHEYYSVRALSDAMSRYNAETLSFCRERGLTCLDLAARLPSDSTMFYDDVHFTEAGAAAVGRLVAAHLRAVRPSVFGGAVASSDSASLRPSSSAPSRLR